MPRIGGLAITIGAIAGGFVLPGPHRLWFLVQLCAMPAFIAGFCEDLSKQVSVRTRLPATILAGVIFAATSAYKLHLLGIPGLNSILSFSPISIAFTGVAMGGIANGMNIIDGCNGLSSGTAIILFFSIEAIACSVHDINLSALCQLCMIATAGFFIWNFPFGKIFLGDAGAYVVGFVLAAFAVALPARNPEISPMTGLLVLNYPASETLYTIIRRARRKAVHVGRPDSLHLHSITFKALRLVVRSPVLRNSLAGAIIWLLPLISTMLAYTLCEKSPRVIMFASISQLALYCAAYSFVAQKVERLRRSEHRD